MCFGKKWLLFGKNRDMTFLTEKEYLHVNNSKGQIRQIIADNNISSATDVYTLLRDGFKDILQELMEVELGAILGYKNNQKGE